MNIVDLHCDSVTHALNRDMDMRDANMHGSFENLKKGGSLAQCFAIYAGQQYKNNFSFSGRPLLDRYRDIYHKFLLEMIYNSDIIKQVRTVEEIYENQKNGLMSAILTIEEGAVMGEDIKLLDKFYNDGVRVFGLIWNTENALAYPNSKDPEIMAKGLKPLGIEAVKRCNELGIVVDVSHLNEGGFFDVVKHSTKPFFATHSNARSVCNHSRNLSDEQLRALGETGSVTGLNFYDLFAREKDVAKEGRHLKTEELVPHAKHIVNVAGIDALAFGSDFDGIDCTLEFKDASGLPQVVDALRPHFTPSEIDKICFQNALRVFKENQK